MVHCRTEAHERAKKKNSTTISYYFATPLLFVFNLFRISTLILPPPILANCAACRQYGKNSLIKDRVLWRSQPKVPPTAGSTWRHFVSGENNILYLSCSNFLYFLTFYMYCSTCIQSNNRLDWSSHKQFPNTFYKFTCMACIFILFNEVQARGRQGQVQTSQGKWTRSAKSCTARLVHQRKFCKASLGTWNGSVKFCNARLVQVSLGKWT